ncbi:MAG TPA: DedA family protein [Spirochaetota bacterium]|nr:DedA family protein [Spirochaetota bacterium]
MNIFFENIINSLLGMSDLWIYAFLFISAVVENLVPPIPGDTITAFGAFLVAIGKLNFFMVLLLTTVGSSLGFTILFGLGLLLGREFFIEKDYRYFSAKSIISAEEWFRKYGYYVVALNRFFPGIRSVISLVCGISRLSAVRVFLLCSLSALIWNFIWIYVGYSLGSNWQIVKARFEFIIRSYNMAAGILIILIVAALIIRYFYKKRK